MKMTIMVRNLAQVSVQDWRVMKCRGIGLGIGRNVMLIELNGTV
jgi:hypothetical protein